MGKDPIGRRRMRWEAGPDERVLASALPMANDPAIGARAARANESHEGDVIFDVLVRQT